MIRINNIHISYKIENKTIEAVKGATFDINDSDYVALVGPAGSGKSTLMSSIAGLLKPNKGEIYIENSNITHCFRSTKAKIRAEKFGIVFQFSELINRLTVEENLKMAWWSARKTKVDIEFEKRKSYLESSLQMKDLMNMKPGAMSGGQKQKAAIATALIKDNPIILADEPSGDLDPESSHLLKELLAEENHNGKTIVIVTHNMKLAFDAKTIFEMKDGVIAGLLK